VERKGKIGTSGQQKRKISFPEKVLKSLPVAKSEK